MLISDKLVDLQELDSASIELLEAVGVDRVTSLAKSSSEHLQVEMAKANGMLRLREEHPDALEIQRWINFATDHAGHRLEAISTAKSVQQSSEAGIQEPLLEAIVISPQKLIDGGIQASDVPIMEEFISEEEFALQRAPVSPAVFDSPEKKSEPKVSSTVGKVSIGKEKKLFSLPDDEGELSLPTDQNSSSSGTREIAPLQGKGRQLINAPLPETNAGKKQHSRSYIRGVLHPQPFKVYFGAFISLLALPMLPLTFVALGVAAWKPEWWMYCAAVPALGVILGLLYLMISTKPRCRICGQPIFVPKRCFRHVKAHHLPLIGYIIPTSIQLILFKWFRCIFCGTAVRLKE